MLKAGHVDRSVTADWPVCAVFHKGAVQTYAAYNPTEKPVTVMFSDGFTLSMGEKGYRAQLPPTAPGAGGKR